MGRGLGATQKQIGRRLLDQALDANALALSIYRSAPTKARLNVVWAALRGMKARRMIRTAGITIGGWQRWELTHQGREDIKALKPEKTKTTKTAKPFKPGVINGGKENP